MGWRPLNNPDFKCLNDVSNIFCQLSYKYPGSFPDFSGSKHLVLFSDYAGGKSDPFLTYSFVLTSLDVLKRASRRLGEWRKVSGVGDRHFDYKKLNDRKKAAALAAFLSLLDDTDAVLVTFKVDSCIRSLIYGDSFDIASFKTAFQINDEISETRAERTIRCAVFGAILVNGLCSGGQDLMWISDDDEIFANDQIAISLRPLILNVYSHMTTIEMGQLQYGVASRMVGPVSDTDLLAACDLSCGYHTTHARATSATILPTQRYRDAVLGRWLARYDQRLRKFSISIEKNAVGKLNIGRDRFFDVADPVTRTPSHVSIRPF